MDERTSVTKLVHELGQRSQCRATESQLLELFQKNVIDDAEWDGLIRKTPLDLPSGRSAKREVFSLGNNITLTSKGKIHLGETSRA